MTDTHMLHSITVTETPVTCHSDTFHTETPVTHIVGSLRDTCYIAICQINV